MAKSNAEEDAMTPAPILPLAARKRLSESLNEVDPVRVAGIYFTSSTTSA